MRCRGRFATILKSGSVQKHSRGRGERLIRLASRGVVDVGGLMDAKNWYDVADTAVKIGLGTLLGGVFAMWRAHVSNRNQAKKSFLEKKREMIETVLKEVDDFYATATVYWADLANAVYTRKTGGQLGSKELQELRELEQQVFTGFKILGYSSSRLRLVNENDAEKSLKKMREVLDAFFQIANIENAHCTEEALESYKVQIQAARGEFFEALSIAYRRDE